MGQSISVHPRADSAEKPVHAEKLDVVHDWSYSARGKNFILMPLQLLLLIITYLLG
jgi:hypothetical protein